MTDGEGRGVSFSLSLALSLFRSARLSSLSENDLRAELIITLVALIFESD